jgi:hypothetical protein
MPFATTWGRSVAYNDPAHGWVIYNFGGYNGSGAYTNQCWAYTVSTGTWEACNNLLAARRSHGGTIYRDTLLAVCGYSSSGFLNSVERGAIEPSASPFSALWLYSDYGNPDTTLGYRLRALGDTLTYLDVQSYTPTLAELSSYSVVGSHSNYPYDDPTALGDTLAAFVDGGGGVVICASSFTSGWNMAGQIMSGAYATIGLGANNQDPTTLGWYNAGHPVMNGVSSVNEWLRASATFVTPDSVARWTDGTPYVGVSGNEKVVGINQYPGIVHNAGRSGDWALVIHNALRFVSGMTGTKEFDPLQPALNLELVTAPNPARQRVQVNFAVAGGTRVEVGLYDVEGRLVRELFSGTALPDVHQLTWDMTDKHGRRVPAGNYFCRLRTADQTVTRKLAIQ